MLAEALGLLTDGPVSRPPTIIKDQLSEGLKESRGERGVLRESEGTQTAAMGDAMFRSKVWSLQGP